MVFFGHEKKPPINFGVFMLPTALFWIFLTSTLVVIGVDIAKKRRGSNR
jgi:hypothetical protein